MGDAVALNPVAAPAIPDVASSLQSPPNAHAQLAATPAQPPALHQVSVHPRCSCDEAWVETVYTNVLFDINCSDLAEW